MCACVRNGVGGWVSGWVGECGRLWGRRVHLRCSRGGGGEQARVRVVATAVLLVVVLVVLVAGLDKQELGEVT